MRAKISAVIITKNEIKNIERCLNSLLWADEIVVFDNCSDDGTQIIATKLGAKLVQNTTWEGFGISKQKAVLNATNDWILSVDADEVVTENLKNDIIDILENPKYVIYSIKRSSYYLGKIINHCGWGNDYPIRLFDRNFAKFNDKKVHEFVESNNPIGRIENKLLHYTYPDINSHLKKIMFYSDLAIESNPNKTTGLFSIIFRGIFKFVQMYWLKLGFLDGRRGFILSLISSFGIVFKYLKFYEKQIND